MTLQDLRRAKRMTQVQLAQKASISQQLLQMVETGKRTPSIKSAKRIAEALSLTSAEAWELFTRSA